MNRDLVPLLCCIYCGGGLTLDAAAESGGRVESGTLRCEACDGQWPIVGFIPRFVSPENYAGNFGLQWNRFRRTQLDSNSGTSISRRRFFETTGWSDGDLRGRRVLDVGCGAGRFAEIALSTGARVIAVDYSSAVEACRDNLLHNDSLDVVQADVYHLPFPRASFDFVYCLGVLQHTPDPARAFRSLCDQLAPEGRISVDVYPRLPLLFLWPKYWLRPWTRRMETARLLALVERFVPWLLPISDAVAAVPVIGRKLRYAVPVMNHRLSLPELSREQVREWAVLDTFDMLSPAYDQPQTEATVREWLARADLHETEVLQRGFLIGRGRRGSLQSPHA